MNGYLVDTHVLLWALFEPERLSQKAREIIADPENVVHVSVITFWEIALKFALGKLVLQGGEPEQLVVAAQDMGLAILPLEVDEAVSFHRLPRLAHKDPFDRMLVRQAIVRELALISRDRAFAEYEEHGLKLVV